ncbi:hypothetical protein MMC20_005270 [Loxospora ochrophaea]|nr:hypothetical protein [Loxospora ochrophaea]
MFHSTRTSLIDLPVDIVSILPNYLCSLQDLYSLLQTCRTLKKACESSKARLPPDFPKLYGQHLLPPHPHLLLAGTVRQVADWAVGNNSNRVELLEALKGGNEGLLHLAVKVSRFSLSDVRILHGASLEVINRLYRTLDLECGQGERQRMREQAESEAPNGDVGDWWQRMTVCEDVARSLYNFWIYCELFHHNVDKASKPDLDIEPLSDETREDWFGYCVPDVNNYKRYGATRKGGFQILDMSQLFQAEGFCNEEKLAQMWLGKDRTEFWTDVPLSSDPDDNTFLKQTTASKRDDLFLRVVGHQGLDTLKMLLPGGKEAFEGKAGEIRSKIQAIPIEDVGSSNLATMDEDGEEDDDDDNDDDQEGDDNEQDNNEQETASDEQTTQPWQGKLIMSKYLVRSSDFEWVCMERDVHACFHCGE